MGLGLGLEATRARIPTLSLHQSYRARYLMRKSMASCEDLVIVGGESQRTLKPQRDLKFKAFAQTLLCQYALGLTWCLKGCSIEQVAVAVSKPKNLCSCKTAI